MFSHLSKWLGVDVGVRRMSELPVIGRHLSCNYSGKCPDSRIGTALSVEGHSGEAWAARPALHDYRGARRSCLFSTGVLLVYDGVSGAPAPGAVNGQSDFRLTWRVTSR